MTLEVSIALTQVNKTWEGTLDIPQQNVKGMALSTLKVTANEVSFTLPEVPGDASYKGSLSGDGREIKGAFTQAGQSLNLIFKKLDALESGRISQGLVEMEYLIDSLRVMRQVPGLAIGIIKDGEVIHAKGYGHPQSEYQQSVTPNTIFAIGSTTKAFVATGVAMLVEDGKIEWDEPVQTYMSDFKLKDPFASQQMTH